MSKPERPLRYIQIFCIVSTLMIADVTRKIRPQQHCAASSLQWIIVGFVVALVLCSFFLQWFFRYFPSRSFPPWKNSIVLGYWMMGHILRLATAQSVALFAFVLHMLGSSAALVYVLYGSSLLQLLFWRPGVCPAQEN